MTKQKNREYKKSRKKPHHSKKQNSKQSSPQGNRKNEKSQGKPNTTDKHQRGKKRVTIEVTCSGLTSEGKGIIQWKGKQLEVANLLPGETAEVFVSKKGRFFNTELKRVINTSEDRANLPRLSYNEGVGCQIQHMNEQAQKRFKQNIIDELMKPFGKPEPIITMEHPYDYRNKNVMTFGMNKKRQIISGLYAENTHQIIPMERSIIHDPKADEIIQTIKGMMKSFKMQPYNEDNGRGFLRHVLVRVGKKSGEIMVVLVAASPMFKGKNNFVKALRKAHPEITTILLNVNKRNDSMVLGNQEKVLFGKGTITDTLCGLEFEISAKSFYQINPVQTEKLYTKAIEMAELTGEETVVDAYCGIGTIGLVASQQAGKVIGVELNKDAVRDAIRNSKRNGVKNARFYQGDAGEFMVQMAEHGEDVDVVFMDPPRSGSDEAFLSSLVKLKPKRVVYVSCNPETQARDLKYLVKYGYKVGEIQPVDMFPQTVHVESVAKLELK
ncbi:23S rRNA (uracil(1939)-C(5))-methyltransferase RlmD [Tenuibacillus multivorans]|uniref:23S rRNA (Uracil1939-C5)-methyltransferase n=1 Tax=Tenuibacillus multivorans TaxID=237069 RepID=A0A1H0DZX3_9BACI|nr:23S rRNA (uracil(1939)-C(5))-methyltransferase RlmD [Tenuibacillus multivorans]GEL76709.1 23S rRNA (uracil-C(5))-methyltransferase RlmCD [Tenuibacillus multivorans]SDN75692.1 23S rRNA (uracil1939-C5)-methyltransferase [Tenuibacillus multivorans]